MKTAKPLTALLLSLLLAACASAPNPSESRMAPSSAQAETTHNAAALERVATHTRAAPVAANQAIKAREALGTQWGDDITSRVTQVDYKRLSQTPVAQTTLRYADKHFSGTSVNAMSLAAGKISFSVIDENGKRLPLKRANQAYYLAAKEGQSYQLVYENSSNQTFEVVASVDGLDVINGRAASKKHSGYLLRAHDRLVIKGFRKSQNAVASFTFSQPKSAYAANSQHGSIQNTGIIGTVVYELRVPKTNHQLQSQYAPAPQAFPADN